MLRKVLVRVLLGCLALAGLVITTIVVAGYYALQQPDYYAQMRSVEFSPADQSAAIERWKQTELGFERWLQTSVARQQAQRSGLSPASEASVPLVLPYDAATDTHEVRLTQEQLNAQLASSKAAQSGDWRNPRVRISAGRIDLAFEVSSDKITCVPSVTLRPTITTNGELRLDILAAHIGQLRLPMKTILRNLPREITCSSSSDITLDLAAPTPSVIVNLPNAGQQSPTVKSLTCREGELVVEFFAPVLVATSL